MPTNINTCNRVTSLTTNRSPLRGQTCCANHAFLWANLPSFVWGMTICLLVSGCANRASSTRMQLTSDKPVTSNEKTEDKSSTSLALSTACDDLPVVMVKENYDSGQLSLEQQVVIGKDGEQIPHGLMTHYWENGNKKLQMEYHCGLKHGLRAAWHQDGQPWSVGEHRNGKDHGEWIVWFANGKKQQQFYMNNGAWNGPYTSWHFNGEKKMKVQYVNGYRQGPLRLWDDQENLVREIHYVDDKVQPTPR